MKPMGAGRRVRLWRIMDPDTLFKMKRRDRLDVKGLTYQEKLVRTVTTLWLMVDLCGGL